MPEEATKQTHECKLSDLVWGNKAIGEPDGEGVSYPVTCRFCGKKYEEVYSRNDGLWDPDLEEYVFLEIGEYCIPKGRH